MSEKIVQLNEEVIKGQLKELVRDSVEETLNELLEAEAEKLTQAARYERNKQRQGYRSGHYSRNLTTTSGDVTLRVPKLKGISFETAIIERYRRRERKSRYVRSTGIVIPPTEFSAHHERKIRTSLMYFTTVAAALSSSMSRLSNSGRLANALLTFISNPPN